MENNLNRNKILDTLNQINKSLQELLKYQDIPNNEILKSTEKLGNIKYQFIIAAEAAIDVCNHITAKMFSQIPESYSNCFEILGDNHVINLDIAEAMAKFAKFRNLLVHLYWKVDDEQVVSVLKNDLHWIKKFVDGIKKYAFSNKGI